MKLEIWILVVFILHRNIHHTNTESLNEYCTIEMFEANCAADEVIVMTKARFGRMRVGRCIEVDLGFIGCGGDVIHIFDEHCSGKQSCSVLVGDKSMHTWSTCTKGLLQYLEAGYECIKAYLAEENACGSGSGIEVSSAEEIIMSNSLIASRCVNIDIPWDLSTNSGQRLNISLIDFQHNIQNPQSNKKYGKIVDKLAGKEITFGVAARQQHLFVSSGNEVEVVFSSNADHFALHATVLGCQDMFPPNGAWMTRVGNVVEIGCHSGGKSWTLTCEDNHWVGAVGFCGTATIQEKEEQQNAVLDISPNVIVFGICSLILLLSSIVFLTGVLILRRKQAMKYHRANQDGSFKCHPDTHLDTMTNHNNQLDSSWSNIGMHQQFHVSTLPAREAAQFCQDYSGHYKSLQTTA